MQMMVSGIGRYASAEALTSLVLTVSAGNVKHLWKADSEWEGFRGNTTNLGFCCNESPPGTPESADQAAWGCGTQK